MDAIAPPVNFFGVIFYSISKIIHAGIPIFFLLCFRIIVIFFFCMTRFSPVYFSICVWAAMLPVNHSIAQSKTFSIPLHQTIVDGIMDKILPGDTILLESGARKEILFKNLTGETAKPIVIINKPGKVVINTDKEYGIFLDNSIHCKITGSGGADKYGIEIASSGNHGLVMAEFFFLS